VIFGGNRGGSNENVAEMDQPVREEKKTHYSLSCQTQTTGGERPSNRPSSCTVQRHSLTRCQAIRRLRTRLNRPNSQPSSFHLRRDRPGYTIAACRQNFQKPLAFFFPSSHSSLSNIFLAFLGTFFFDFFLSKVDSSMELEGDLCVCVLS